MVHSFHFQTRKMRDPTRKNQRKTTIKSESHFFDCTLKLTMCTRSTLVSAVLSTLDHTEVWPICVAFKHELDDSFLCRTYILRSCVTRSSANQLLRHFMSVTSLYFPKYINFSHAICDEMNFVNFAEQLNASNYFHS